MNAYDYLLSGEPSDESIAIIDSEDRPWSYGQLRCAVEHLCGYIEQSALPGERCAIYAANGPMWITTFLAVIRSGRVAVPIPAEAPESLVHRIIRSCSPRLAFVDARRVGPLASLHQPDLIVIAENSEDDAGVVDMDEALACLPPEHSYATQGEDLAAIFYTAGTTGDPRGVMISHLNIAASTSAAAECLRLSAIDRVMHLLPMSSWFGASLLTTHLRSGGGVVLQRQPIYPAELSSRLHETACTGFAGTPGTYQLLLANPVIAARTFPHLRYLQLAGGRMPSSMLGDLHRALPGKPLYIMYGQTEATAFLSCLTPDLPEAAPDCVGRSLPGIRLEVVNAQGLPVAPGETGDIVAQGPCVAGGYWHEPEQTSKVFRNGRLYTGDLGTLDSDGMLHITGRSRDFLKLGGVRVSCAQIEQAICMFPGIRELAVISKDDDLLGQSVVLFAVHPRGEEVHHQLAEFCALHLPFSQRPREIYFRTHLPHNAFGKVDHRALQEDLSVQVTVPVCADTLQVGQNGDAIATA